MVARESPNTRTLVMKFGGTSVGSEAALREVVHIVSSEHKSWPRLVVVTSAMSGVTNLLLDTAARAVRGDTSSISLAVQELRRIHFDTVERLIPNGKERQAVEAQITGLIETFTNLCQAIAVLGEASPRALDAIAGMGERLAVRLLAGALNAHRVPAKYVEATSLIVTDDRFQSAHPDFEATKRQTRSNLNALMDAGAIPVVTGFIAATSDGITTTLGRGGSDYSAAILGAVLPATEVWIWTDVDGVMTSDPRLVPNARTIPELTYREIAELAYYGAKVVHPKTIRPVVEAGISLRVCNTFNPSHPGTRIIPDRPEITNGKNGAIKAVTAIREQSLVTIEGRGMLGVPGVAARTFGAVAATGTSVPLITQASSEQSICFAVPIESRHQVMAALDQAFASELARKDIDRIWASDEVVIITIVGAGMSHTPGIAGRIFGCLGDQAVNVIAIAQGSSEVSISLVVDRADQEKALQSLHALIVKKPVNNGVL
ncbi:MAG: aspartate kinase [Anaerolineales bacterium]